MQQMLAGERVCRSFIPRIYEPRRERWQRNGGYYVASTRVSLDSIVYSFKAGDSPETIRQNFPSLNLEQVYGTTAFYLAHEQEVDANIREGERTLDGTTLHLRESRPELYSRRERVCGEIAARDLARH
jgi:uncharacterized protein (DUF433 family)